MEGLGLWTKIKSVSRMDLFKSRNGGKMRGETLIGDGEVKLKFIIYIINMQFIHIHTYIYM